jgi:nucleoside phosphorylase
MASPGHENSVDVLIMAAHALELECFVTSPGASSEFFEVAGCTLRAVEVGVGLPLAGAGAMRALLQTRARAAVLVGSCGLYADRAVLEPGQVLIPTNVRAVDAATLAGQAAFPAPMPNVLEPDPALTAGLVAAGRDTLRGALATTLAITTDDALAARLARESSCLAENLEALAVALACRAAGVAFTAVLGVTNQVGASGREQWRKHHARAAQTTFERVVAWLQSGAAGLPPRNAVL